MSALAEVGNIALVNVWADGETPAEAPRLSIPQLAPDGHVHVAGSSGAWGATCVIQASADLIHWTPISTNLPRPTVCLDCPVIDLEDRESSTLAQRFYRAVLAPMAPLMSSNDVATVMAQALTRAHYFMTNGTATNGVVAVVDREGFVLGVWSLSSGSNGLDVLDAITKAGTAAFLSSDQQAFSSRTAGFIVQQNFPPGIQNRPSGPLVGVNFSNLSFSDVNRFKDPQTYSTNAFGGGGTNGAPISGPQLAALSGLAGSPGGLPLYKNDQVVGGVGAVVTGQAPIPELYDIQTGATQRPDVDEDVALAGQFGFEPTDTIVGSGVFIDGIRLPYVSSQTERGMIAPGSIGSVVPPFAITDSPPVSYPTASLGGVAGEIRAPIIGDPINNLIDGVARLTASEVTDILTLAAQRAAITRAGIRLPGGQPAQVFISVVNNPDNANTPPIVLGTFRTRDATIFSWDVSVQKARTALFFSNPLTVGALPTELIGQALSTRTIGFLAQSFYPPGISGTAPGPLLGLQEKYSLLPVGVTNPLNGVQFAATDPPPTAPDPNLPNGITVFPGGFPLYRDGKLVGAIGVSGDGVDQDDLIAAAGTVHFLAPAAIRADQIIFRGARLPYAKFPRNPSL
jgi:uncharacterized protein GlcG (DUF336 family)